MTNDLLTNLKIEPLSQANWDKFEALFGSKGACGNCWCMFYRYTKKDFDAGKVNDINKNRMKELVGRNVPTGVLGICDGQAIAWCAFAPREDFLKLKNSRVHQRIDDRPVWSIPCFFIDKNFRRKGVSVAMLNGIIAYAKKNGIRIIEAYPSIPTQEKLPDSFAWIGLYKSFENAGFEIVDLKSKNRPMVRYFIH